jgi:hypothetical protein
LCFVFVSPSFLFLLFILYFIKTKVSFKEE